MAWDLSPLRPWEWWEADAQEWTEAQAVQQAVRDGIEDANVEQKRDGKRD